MSTAPVHVFELSHPTPTATATPVVFPPNTPAEYADVVPQEMRPCLWWDWQLDTAAGSFYPFCTLCQRYADQGHLESRLHCRHMADHNKTMPSWSSWKQLGPGYGEMTGIDASKAPKPASTFCVPPPPVEPSPPPLPCTTKEIEDNVLMLLYFATKEWSVQAGILTEHFIDCMECSLTAMAAHGVTHVSQLQEASATALGGPTVASLLKSYIAQCKVPFLQVAVDGAWPRSMCKRPKLRRSYVTDVFTVSPEDTLEDVLTDGILEGLSWEDLGVVLYKSYEDMEKDEGKCAVNYEDLCDRCFQAASKGYPCPDLHARLALLTSHSSKVARAYIGALQLKRAEEEDSIEAEENNEDVEETHAEEIYVGDAVEMEISSPFEPAVAPHRTVNEEWCWNADRWCWEVSGYTDPNGTFIGREDILQEGDEGWICEACLVAGRICGEVPPMWSSARWYCPCCGSSQQL